MAPEDPKTKKILVIDDDEGHVDIVKHVLSKEGFQVFTAMDGAEAIKQIAAVNPDLITMDLMIPGVSGLELIRHLQSEGMGSVPVIVITGRVSESHVNDEQILRQEYNVKEFIGKPLRTAMLVMRVHQILDTALAKKAGA